MTGPADDGELVVKMLNSGAPGVMLDLEDSMANAWPNAHAGHQNIHAALNGTLTYEDRKARAHASASSPSPTVIWSRVRGLHLSQAGIYRRRGLTSASLFDLAMLVWPLRLEAQRIRSASTSPRPSRPKKRCGGATCSTRSSARKRWDDGTDPSAWRWSSRIRSPSRWKSSSTTCATTSSGLNLGRWDYMASLIHFTLADPAWVLPDRNTIPHDVPFFQRLRHLHGGHLPPARRAGDRRHDRAATRAARIAELNARALAVLEQDKKNEASCFMDGAWTGHPDQNAIAVAQFPAPNQLGARPPASERYPDLRPVPSAVGRRIARRARAPRCAPRSATATACSTARGASLLDGYMEDLATDRIYRLMIAQRMVHRDHVTITGPDGSPVPHTPGARHRAVRRRAGEAARPPRAGRDLGGPETMREARRINEKLIQNGWFSPI